MITNLDEAGFEARHIRAVSGNKSDETIKSYSVRCPDKKKKEMSDALSNKLKDKTHQPAATVSKPPEEYRTISFEDIVDYVPIEKMQKISIWGQ